jgi:hypothetical protein
MSNKFDSILGEYRQDDASSALKLDQTTPQTIVKGVPLLTTPVNIIGSKTQVVNKQYVDQRVNQAIFTYFV